MKLGVVLLSPPKNGVPKSVGVMEGLAVEVVPVVAVFVAEVVSNVVVGSTVEVVSELDINSVVDSVAVVELVSTGVTVLLVEVIIGVVTDSDVVTVEVIVVNIWIIFSAAK